MNAKTDTDESWWGNTGWTPYRVARGGARLHGIDGGGDGQHLEALPGKQISW